MFETIIIGSGPAGLFAALNLVNNGKDSICIIDKNPFPSGGMLNDCKLNLSTEIGMDLGELRITKQKAKEYIDFIDKTFLSFGAPDELYGYDEKLYKEWAERAKKNDVEFIPSLQRHIGTDLSKKIIKNFRNYLEQKNVKIRLSTEIVYIEKKNSHFFLKSSTGEEFFSKYLLIAPGRSGSSWLREISKKLKISYSNGKKIDVGIRVEMKKESYPITDVIYDPKFKMFSKYKNILRTFCTNPKGRVTLERYDDFTLVNGDALKMKKTENTNFALLDTIILTEPLTDPFVYGRLISIATNILGNGKPIIQRIGDFLDEKRSKLETFFDKTRWFDRVKPTLQVGKLVTPGDIRMAYPYKIVKELKEGLIKLNKIFGNTILKEENIIYAPEVKFYSISYETTDELETNVKNIFVAGDGAGKSRGIVGAAISGLIASNGILNKG